MQRSYQQTEKGRLLGGLFADSALLAELMTKLQLLVFAISVLILLLGVSIGY